MCEARLSMLRKLCGVHHTFVQGFLSTALLSLRRCVEPVVSVPAVLLLHRYSIYELSRNL